MPKTEVEADAPRADQELEKVEEPGWLKRPLTRRQLVVGLGLIVLIVGVVGGLVVWAVGMRNKTASLELAVSQIPKVVRPKFDLTLESPASGDVVLDDRLVVKGKTLPETTVVFYTETDEDSVESDDRGNFEGNLTLQTGINTLTVAAFADDGEEKTVVLDLVYDEESVRGVKAGKAPPGQAKKEAPKKTPPGKAVIGNVEEVDDDSIVVSEKGKGEGKGRVKTKVDKETKIVGQDKKLLRLDSLQPDDLAAVIASDSGDATGSAEPKAHKIYVRKAARIRQTKRRAVHGVITSLAEPVISLVHQIHRERSFMVTTSEATVFKVKGVTEATFADLEVGQRIAVVGDLDEDESLVAKRIHVIPGQATGIFERLPLEVPGDATPPSGATASPTLSLSPTTTPSSPTATPEEATPTPTSTLPTATPTLETSPF